MHLLRSADDRAPEMKVDKRLVLSVAQVRTLLGLSPTSIYRALHKGDIPAERVGGTWLIRKDAFFEKFGSPPETQGELAPTSSHGHRDSTDALAAAGDTAKTSAPDVVLGSNEMHDRKPPTYITPKQAAEILGLKDKEGRTVKRTLLGKLRYRMNGREYLIELESVYEYIEQTTLGPKTK